MGHHAGRHAGSQCIQQVLNGIGPGIVACKDRWFIAFHRFHIPDGNGYNREVCISPMRFETDGTIRAVDVFEPAYAYLMAYFGPQQKLFYAYSFDARAWRALGGGKPVWSPPFVRDPFINRVNGKFHLVHTTGWTGTTIGHWESDDLINWTGGPIQVVGPKKQKCWAPEFFYSESEDVFYVFWASVHDGHNAMHYLRTKDWKSIGPGDSTSEVSTPTSRSGPYRTAQNRGPRFFS